MNYAAVDMKTREAVIEAGKTRIIPVLLTALAAILAFIPIAVGFNINFVSLFSELNPHIFFGGDNVAFWKPLSWTIIFGFAFAFFMTLIIVPSMYLIAERLRRPDAQNVWWQMDQLYGHSANDFYLWITDDCHYVYSAGCRKAPPQ